VEKGTSCQFQINAVCMTTNRADTKYNILTKPPSPEPLDHVFARRMMMTTKKKEE